MEHWRFFIAILILLLLMRPVHEYFTEDDAMQFGKDITNSENKIDSLNRVYYSSRLPDITTNLTSLSSKI
jgi:hypothetical protein